MACRNEKKEWQNFPLRITRKKNVSWKRYFPLTLKTRPFLASCTLQFFNKMISEGFFIFEIILILYTFKERHKGKDVRIQI